MDPIVLIPIILVLLGLVLLILISRSQANFGVLAKKRIDYDTTSHPGEVLHSTSIPLVGKPDYLIRDQHQIIPVEIKTGGTPDTPKKHHVMQLLAYCYLVEENFGITPEFAILKYPHREFKVGYSPVLREQVKSKVYEILQMKQSGTEPVCTHPHHNL